MTLILLGVVVVFAQQQIATLGPIGWYDGASFDETTELLTGERRVVWRDKSTNANDLNSTLKSFPLLDRSLTLDGDPIVLFSPLNEVSLNRWRRYSSFDRRAQCRRRLSTFRNRSSRRARRM